jgi:hypothetical protein
MPVSFAVMVLPRIATPELPVLKMPAAALPVATLSWTVTLAWLPPESAVSLPSSQMPSPKPSASTDSPSAVASPVWLWAIVNEPNEDGSAGNPPPEWSGTRPW